MTPPFEVISGYNPPAAGPAQLSLEWDPAVANTDASILADIKGYKVYYGTETGVYTDSLDLTAVSGNELDTECILTGLLDGVTYYCSPVTIDDDGNESAYATEVNAVASIPVTPSEPTWTDIGSADLPYTISSNGNYRLSESVTYGSGAAITVNGGLTDVKIYGSNRSWGDGEAGINFTYANGGNGQAINVASGSVVDVYGFNFILGTGTHSANSGGCPVYTSGTFGAGSKVHDCDFDLDGNYARGVYAATNLNGIRIYDNTGTFANGSANQSLVFGTANSIANRVRIYNNNITMDNASWYVGLVHFCDYAETYGNTLTINSNCVKPFLVQGWSTDYQFIHNNTVVVNGVNTRICNQDGGSANWWLHYNNFVLNQSVAGVGISRAIRLRYGGNNQVVGYNTIDADADIYSVCHAWGGSDQIGASYGLYLYKNNMTSRNICFEIYGDEISQGYGGRTWGNTMNAVAGYCINMNANTLDIDDIEFNDDILTAVGDTVRIQTHAPAWRVHDSFNTNDVTGNDANINYAGTPTYPVSNTPNAPTGVVVQ